MRKNGDLVGGRRVKKPRICDFPLQSAAIQRPVAVREQHCLPLAKRRGADRDFRGDLHGGGEIPHFCAIVHFVEPRANVARRNLTSRNMGTLKV